MLALIIANLPGLSIPVALAVVAVLGYVIGCRRREEIRVNQATAMRDLRRAWSVVRRLESVSLEVRVGLETHEKTVREFKRQLVRLSRRQGGINCSELSDEADRILKPTMYLSRQLGHAYDELRQHTNALLAFTEVRTDPLTRVNNRRGLDETLANLFAMMCRYGATFSIAIFDIDHFKLLNDEHGHVQGDVVLQNVAQALRDSVRETDFVARYGGEEFVVVMPETGLSGARIFSDRVRAAIASKLEVTVSGGVAMASDKEEPAALVARADTALYAAKNAGRNRIFEHDGTELHPVPRCDEELALSREATLGRATGSITHAPGKPAPDTDDEPAAAECDAQKLLGNEEQDRSSCADTVADPITGSYR
ncbi:GGDEF domain-containing protein [Lignipirellula cremea]|uniref:diguanylate cyclase n=1 Tax=Lignipirellula cremea TaxID=2528010 RepID=A0A518DYG7_9BACT|nr:GGDEF domain-containing protein [Lignipirellula cremea]QDU96886.1 Diguanylate cyclase DosC [Lignipirellula cremea]